MVSILASAQWYRCTVSRWLLIDVGRLQFSQFIECHCELDGRACILTWHSESHQVILYYLNALNIVLSYNHVIVVKRYETIE